MKQTIVWTDKYKGISFEIKYYKDENPHAYRLDNWTWYLYLREEMFTKEEWSKYWLEPRCDKKRYLQRTDMV